ncbi:MULTISPECIES: hypothetical protein [unclassified Microcoleus]|jgi:hypothetical protein|uniref:hypothetical protein n=1 Tax=unclassified Microcoleus TaxID=2642155 RepID=UPI001D263A6B|nr:MULTISPECIES: hypothetical protein [unclassified Microcoleus]MCC3431461.1 hypothetical protein [Microcoleus sp. PH2017_04_SCI_O_A]MCC3440528.1 hypothetical protein [Microcoleus sp. PH2017_03_ELD_O_A]MCC3466411.1 hypothetical protein [Microcoleus sp. PH2017_06_SFM_O_A]MCC3502169.1 hypothetical protein [Microcoleus sp. PH2017_19_SFW_U_A]MCC3510640.1 hypothetical protein [Microcoleus sp. PH2017_17_BER_D_A]TAE12615.1 MAG: hypothetical protein EAZ94_12540 [Oscillatoriales cyanobacterium]
MSDQLNNRVVAPCIIDTGIVVNKRDIKRLLFDLGRVRYLHIQDGKIYSEGEGYVLEVFANPDRSTLIANHALYLNVYSFDYLELKHSPEEGSYFDLMQDGRQLRLIPLSNPLQEQVARNLNAAALDAVVDQVLSGNWDLQLDEDDSPF